MTDKQLSSVLKYSSINEIYIITADNYLKRIICPFEAEVVSDVGEFFKGQIVRVDFVKVTRRLITVFIINSKPFYYYHFDFII